MLQTPSRDLNCLFIGKSNIAIYCKLFSEGDLWNYGWFCKVVHALWFLFVCLFVWSFTSHSRIFHSYGDVTITGLQILPILYTRGFFSVPHLLWHDLRGPVTLTLIAKCLAVELSLLCFYDLGLLRLGFVHPTFRLWGERSSPLRHGRAQCMCLYGKWVIMFGML